MQRGPGVTGGDARDVHGILLFDKPLGASSAGAVARIKRLFQASKAGHTGALDPLATGLLPVCLGEATKFGAQLLDADKTYRVTVRLGERTASADRESPVIERRQIPAWDRDQLERALAAFPRRYDQVPPMHSALKQDGKPLYEYARAGQTVERAPREVRIHLLDLTDWSAPDLTFEVCCSKGAYIRVLAEDLAAQLGTIGHLASLRRIAVAPFGSAQAPPRLWSLEALEAMSLEERRGCLLPVDAALASWPRIDLPAAAVAAFRQGRTVSIGSEEAQKITAAVRVYAAMEGFVGLATSAAAGLLKPTRLVAAPPPAAAGSVDKNRP